MVSGLTAAVCRLRSSLVHAERRMGNEINEHELRSRYERSFGLSERLALLILVGLLVEIAAILIYQKSFIEGALTVGAAGLILAGAWGELVFQRRAREAGDGIVARAKELAAKYENEAAQAKLQLEQLRSTRGPRLIDGHKFCRALQGKAKATVEVIFPKQDGEAYLLAQQFFALLQDAGWEVREPIPISSTEITRLSTEPLRVAAGGMPVGVAVLGGADANENFDLFGNIAGASPVASIFNALAETFGGADRCAEADVLNTPPPGVVRIVVGQKP